METLAERLKWLRKKHGFKSKSVAAQAMGMNYGTYQGYEYGLFPGKDNYKKIAGYYKCSLLWLKDNEGDPYPKAGGPVPPAGPTYIKEEAVCCAGAPAQQFNIMEDLDLAARVLGSNTHYATALHLNIRSFSGAIARETATDAVISKCHEDLRKQGEQIEQLQTSIKNLREEIKELKRTGGDSPPTALGMDHAALTGTVDPGT